jgi:hypothetical protein
LLIEYIEVGREVLFLYRHTFAEIGVIVGF